MRNRHILAYLKLLAFSSVVVFIQPIVSNLFVVNKIWYPDLTLILIVVLGQLFGRRKSTVNGFWIGLLQDISSGLLGFFSLSKTISSFVAGYFPYDENYNRTKFVYSLLATVSIHNLIYYGLVFYGYQTFFNSLIRFIIPNTLYTIFIGIILYFLLEKWIIGYYGSRD